MKMLTSLRVQLIASTLLLSLVTAIVTFAESIPSSEEYSLQGLQLSQNSLPPLQGRVVTAPAGSYINASLVSPISSEFARVGDRFNATLGNDLAAGGNVILPAGSQLEAQVVSVVKAGRAGRNGQLDIRFTAATTPSGQRVPISGKVQTEDGTGLIKGGTMGGRLGKAALKTGVGAGLGAALGTAMGPLSGGEVGRGAIYGTAIGGGVGALAAAWQKGVEAVLPAGQPLNVVLDQPLTVTPAVNTQPSSYGQPYSQPYTQPVQNNPYNYGSGY